LYYEKAFSQDDSIYESVYGLRSTVYGKEPQKDSPTGRLHR